METRLLFAVRRGRTFIRVNAVEKLNQLENANLQPGFFPQFAADRFLQGFPNFDAAARDGPFAKQGLGTTTNEHGPALSMITPPTPITGRSGYSLEEATWASLTFTGKRLNFHASVYNTLQVAGTVLVPPLCRQVSGGWRCDPLP